MLKPSVFINEQGGFILPYVLFLVALLFIVLSTSISLYQNELRLTEIELEEIHIETLFQRAQTEYMEDLDRENPDKVNQYRYPEGCVRIEYFASYEKIKFIVTTKKQTRRSFFLPFHMDTPS